MIVATKEDILRSGGDLIITKEEKWKTQEYFNSKKDDVLTSLVLLLIYIYNPIKQITVRLVKNCYIFTFHGKVLFITKQ